MKKISLAVLTISSVFLMGCSSTPKVNTVPETPSTEAEMQTEIQTESTTENPQSTYTLAEVGQHNSASDCWLVISGSVYNVTDFIPNHPGGEEIVKGCGKDATSLFTGEHEHQEGNAAAQLPALKIGTLAE